MYLCSVRLFLAYLQVQFDIIGIHYLATYTAAKHGVVGFVQSYGKVYQGDNLTSFSHLTDDMYKYLPSEGITLNCGKLSCILSRRRKIFITFSRWFVAHWLADDIGAFSLS
jgi:hypothetical protein